MSLKNKVEVAVLALMQTNALLSACHPRKSITAEPGTDFPVLWTQAQRPTSFILEGGYYKVPVRIVLETQFDDPLNDKLFSCVERLTHRHAMIEFINGGNFGFHCFDNLPGDDTETVAPNYRSQTCALTLVCCETE